MGKGKKVIVAPLNWGMGHATRCIPIINRLILMEFTPVIATDGQAMLLLQKEFPELEFLHLPSYGVKYKKIFALGMLLSVPNILMGVVREYFVVKKYIHQNKVCAIISDNRLGVFHKKIKSIYITHQLNIKAGVFSKYANSLHHYFVKKHQICWVPDDLDSRFTGGLSSSNKINKAYVGVLSRFKYQKEIYKYDLLVLLSGIASQRESLENDLKDKLKSYKGRVLWVRGSFSPKTKLKLPDNFKVVDYLLSSDLEKAINSTKTVLSRSGYSTVMDLIQLQKKAFLIPTPGQTEQEFLAIYLLDKKMFSSCSQKEFEEEKLNIILPFITLKEDHKNLLDKELLSFFQSEMKG